MRNAWPILGLCSSFLFGCAPENADTTSSNETGGKGGSAQTGGEGGIGNQGGTDNKGGATNEGGTGNQGGTTSMTGSGGNGGATNTTGSGEGGSGAGLVLGPDQCEPPPSGVTVGIEVGQQLPDFTVKNCAGEDFSLTELCGANGLFLFGAHGWCPLCQNVSTNAEAIHDSFHGSGLVSAIIVLETGSSQPPTANYCNIWKDQFGLEDVITLYDPTGKIKELWPGISSSVSAFIDKDRVIVSKLYHDGNVDNIKAGIAGALNP